MALASIAANRPPTEEFSLVDRCQPGRKRSGDRYLPPNSAIFGDCPGAGRAIHSEITGTYSPLDVGVCRRNFLSRSACRMTETSEPTPQLPRNCEPTAALPAGETVEGQFERAVADHSRRLLAVARGIVGNRASPEDVVQQALMNLFKHRARYDWREPGGLLRRAVVNESLRILRQPRMAVVDEEYHGGAESPPETEMVDRETTVKVRAAIDRLPENFRAALVLCEYERMPYADIAKALDASVPQVKTWIFRARRRLAGMLKEFGPEGR